MAKFADAAGDVAAFAKNAGPQCLRIDYLAEGGRLAFYTPDFFIRMKRGDCYLVETKGREDRDVPRKARAAVAWCASAAGAGTKWHYLYVPQGVFERMRAATVEELARACAPALADLVREEEREAEAPLFASVTPVEERPPEVKGLVDEATLDALPARHRKQVDQAVMLFRFLEDKAGMNYAPVFNALLGSMDEAARGLMVRRMGGGLPATVEEQKAWFAPYMGTIDQRTVSHYQQMAQNLKRTLVFRNGLSPVGLLRSCMDYALNDNTKLGGVFDAVRTAFRVDGGRKMLAAVTEVNDFRNTYVAHQEKELTDARLAGRELKMWVELMKGLGAT